MRGKWRLVVLAVVLVPSSLLALDAACPPDLSRAGRLSTELRDSSGGILNVAVTSDGFWRLRPRMEGVTPLYRSLLLAREDRWFAWHPGVNPLSVLRASWQVLRHGRVVSGGSTIAMQTVRLLHPEYHHARNWRGIPAKLLEMARAVQLQAHLGREGVLALYETLVPMGGNVEGVRSASLIWFGHEPDRLSREEASLLVAIPQSPTSRRPDRHQEAARRGAAHVLDIAQHGKPDGSDAIWPDIRWHRFPVFAQHLTARFGRDAGPVETMLDRHIQSGTEQAITSQLEQWSGSGADMAALVIRNRDRAVLAYVGGGHYFGPTGMVDAGMVDMVRAIRSPGSTLKPFLYAMAFDHALAAPDTLIADAPLQVSTYAPHNFDHRWHGDVTARHALQRSLNIPAVVLLARLGPDRFLAALRAAGMTVRLPKGAASAGLSLALGGVGVRMEDLAALYAGLASGGIMSPLTLRRDGRTVENGRLCSASSAAAVLESLRDTSLPDGVAKPERPIAYKTGTSYGFRDAWSVGVSPLYTIMVWSGRKDGAPRPGAYGLTASGPVLFRLFDLLPPEAPLTVASPERKGRLGAGLARLGQSVMAQGPRILFPPRGAVIDSSEGQPVDLRAAEGTPPYRWMVDGRPLPGSFPGQSPVWTPSKEQDGPGFHRLTVQDSAGRSDSVEVRLMTEAQDVAAQ
ncbi:penicillin-binding protein 1C [Granulibacter bethesdensis]|uniref:penicillin-binding protein 1C n=1 Tax=Granulibacter bethesdensis TaxID=364410 RepID=UPI0003F205D7|nr:penicillin-binding protein 1C [Granulibacter bethesdensis]AHJ66890.1 Multimodular transpeptidase-transglycosylase [Granulibacter bethesdensis CGDNIH4]